MLLSSVQILTKKSFPIGSVSNYLKFAVNMQRIPKVSFSTTKSVNVVEYLEGVISRPILGTSNDSTVTRNPKEFCATKLDDIWLSKAKQNDFLSYFPGIVDEIAAKAATFSKLDNGNRIRRAMEYIMPGSNRFPGVITVETYKLLTPEHKHTTENLKLAYYLGWILEIVLEAINMSDDVYDECKTRRNRVCWHELPDVGPSAVNDAFMMEAGAYYLLKKYFGKPDCHTRLLEILNETTFLACIGQHVDVISSKDFDKIKIETFDDIVANISVYLASFSSIALGMTLAGYTNLSIMKEAKSILADIGYFYVIQNDFYDSFGDPNVMGKVSSDIGEGRCRWPALLTMQLGTPEQKEVLKVNYGRKDPECVAKVIELYRELNLPRLYDDYCNNLGSRMLGDVDKLQDGDMKKICEKLVESVFYAMYKKYPVFV